MDFPYPEEACKRPEALEVTFDRVAVERLWKPRTRLAARVARDKVVNRWPERRARGSRADMIWELRK